MSVLSGAFYFRSQMTFLLSYLASDSHINIIMLGCEILFHHADINVTTAERNIYHIKVAGAAIICSF